MLNYSNPSRSKSLPSKSSTFGQKSIIESIYISEKLSDKSDNESGEHNGKTETDQDEDNFNNKDILEYINDLKGEFEDMEYENDEVEVEEPEEDIVLLNGIFFIQINIA